MHQSGASSEYELDQSSAHGGALGDITDAIENFFSGGSSDSDRCMAPSMEETLHVRVRECDTYGKRTASGFSTYEEFQYTMDEQKPFFLIKMCERWSEPHVRGQLGARTMFDQWMPGEAMPDGLARRVIARLREVQGLGEESSRGRSSHATSSTQ